MTETPPALGRQGWRRRRGPAYAALDLGTNNCRLLIATPGPNGFRILESYSRIVRLGEGLWETGVLSEPAMSRAMAALKVCANRMARRHCVGARTIATQACRAASNGADFLERVRAETGLDLEVISPKEEAELALAGCLGLLDSNLESALVVDVGGGSTELIWVDLRAPGLMQCEGQFQPSQLPIQSWVSIPLGIVTLAERFPEPEADQDRWFEAMVAAFRTPLEAFREADRLRPIFEAGRAHMVGTSGAITSLAGLHLQLPRYDRSKVDGLWMTCEDCETVRRQLQTLTLQQRTQLTYIGPDRADLVLAGAAIMEAVQSLWPCNRVRVADRGLREGLLMSLMSDPSGDVRARRMPQRLAQRLPA